MKKIIILLLIYKVGYSVDPKVDSFPVRVTFYEPLMSEKYLPGHIEAEILNIDKLIDLKILSKKDNYYINYWPSGNKKPEINPSKKYKGVKSIIVYLNKKEITHFVNSANQDSKKVNKQKDYEGKLIFGNWKTGYNLLMNNCADAVARAFNLNINKGITVPLYVYNKLKK